MRMAACFRGYQRTLAVWRIGAETPPGQPARTLRYLQNAQTVDGTPRTRQKLGAACSAMTRKVVTASDLLDDGE
jgi:hypothetical protein